MKLSMDPTNLNYFEALASATRLEIIRLLSEQDMNIKELAEALDISSSIMTKHVRKLESAGLIRSTNISKDGNRQKVCSLLPMIAEIETPFKEAQSPARKKNSEISMPVGLFSDVEAGPSCGMLLKGKPAGDPSLSSHLLTPRRHQAERLWIAKGFVEYLFPYEFSGGQLLGELEIDGEFGPAPAENGSGQASSVTVLLNGAPLCTFGLPAWDRDSLESTSIRVVIQMGADGVRVNGEKRSPLTITDLPLLKDRWHLRLETGAGMTIFNKADSRKSQGILLRTYSL